MRRLLPGFLLTVFLLLSPFAALAEENSQIAYNLQAARNYMQNGQWAYASYEWRNVLNSDPGNQEAIIGLARSMMQTGMMKDALRHLQVARRRKPVPEVDLTVAECLQKMGETQAAVKVYRYVLTHSPYNAQAFQGLQGLVDKLPSQQEQSEIRNLLTMRAQEAKQKGLAALDADKYNEARTFLALSAAASPDTINNYGLALLLSGQNQEAAQTFHQLRIKEPKSWRIYANAAMSSLSLGKTYQAKREMEKAIAMCPEVKDKARLYNNLGYIYEAASKPTFARFAYEKAVELNPGLTKARMNLAYIFQRLMELDRAVATYQGVVQRHPEKAEAWNQLGFTYERMHESRKAISAYQRAIQADPGLQEAYFNLATLYKKMDKLSKASDIYKRLAELEFSKLEQPQATAALPEKRKSKLLEYVYLYFDELPG